MLKRKNIKMKYKIVAFFTSALCAIILITTMWSFLGGRNETQVVFFEKEVNRYLSQEYESNSERLYGFNNNIRQSYKQYIERNVNQDYWRRADFGLTANAMKSISSTRLNAEMLNEKEFKNKIRSTFNKLQQVYPIKDLNVIVLPSAGGVDGAAVADNLILLYVGSCGSSELTLKEIECACSHEYMHLISEAVAKKANRSGLYSENLMADMILEGKAIVFARQQMNGYISLAESRLEAQNPWRYYNNYLDSSNYKMIDGNISTVNGITVPRVDIYFYGKAIVDSALKKNGMLNEKWWESDEDSIFITEAATLDH